MERAFEVPPLWPHIEYMLRRARTEFYIVRDEDTLRCAIETDQHMVDCRSIELMRRLGGDHCHFLCGLLCELESLDQAQEVVALFPSVSQLVLYKTDLHVLGALPPLTKLHTLTLLMAPSSTQASLSSIIKPSSHRHW